MCDCSCEGCSDCTGDDMSPEAYAAMWKRATPEERRMLKAAEEEDMARYERTVKMLNLLNKNSRIVYKCE